MRLSTKIILLILSLAILFGVASASLVSWLMQQRADEAAEEDPANDISSPSMRTVISKEGWKLSLSNRGNSQLFDLNNDPYETTNLFYNEEYSQKVRELTEKIIAWQRVTNDTIINFN